jgi:tryptophanyl-tRNA synthetase
MLPRSGRPVTNRKAMYMIKRIDPWKSQDIKDYGRLMEQFGIKDFKKILNRVPNPHLLMRRGIIFGHRDFERILDSVRKGKLFAMMTGLMPSGKFHLGHKALAEQFIFYQNLGAELYICVADIEAYNMRRQPLEELRKIAIEEYLLNYIALGLKPKKVHFYLQSARSHDAGKANAFYRLIGLVTRKTTFNEMKDIYGELSPGKIMSVMTQVADILHPQLDEFGGPKPVVVPVGVDQDPHIRLTRDIASRMKEFRFVPPASTYHEFLPGLKGHKMSSSDPYSYISLDDSPEKIKEKIVKYAFSGGRGSVKEHRLKGGVPEVDVAFKILLYGMETDDKKIKKIYEDYRSGALLTGELKEMTIEKLNSFLKEHKKKCEQARKQVDKFLKE